MMVAAALLATPVFASPPPSVDADEAANQVEDANEAEASPRELPAWMYEEDPAAAARFAAMSEQDFDALVERSEDVASLSPEDLAVLELLAGEMEREFDAGLDFQTGDVTIGSNLATLHLGDEYRFLDANDSRKVLVEGWGNPPSAATGVLGMIFPVGLRTQQLGSWGVILTFSEDGYVDDDDAEDLDYDELLVELEKGSAEEDKQRVAQGYPAMRLQGWAEQPHYDEDKRALYWALSYAVEGSPDNALNFAIRVLGRRGVLELNGVAGMSQLAAIKPAMEDVYGLVEFNPGNRYDDFDPDLDKVAAYGIGGLILGKIAMKAGFFAALLKILLAGKKFLILAGIGAAAFFRRRFGRKGEGES